MGIVNTLATALTGSPATKGLTARSHAERVAAFGARKKEIDAHHERIRAEHTQRLMRANEEAAEETARAQKAVDDRTDALSRELASEIRKRVDPLIAQFVHARTADGAPASPRDTARELATVWKELAGRVTEEVGENIDERFIAFALLDLHGGDAAARAASKPDFWDASLQAAYDASQALLSRPLPTIEAALRHCDEVMANRIAECPSYVVRTDRVAVTRIHAARGRAHAALTAFDEAREKERQTKAIAANTAEAAEREAKADKEYRERVPLLSYDGPWT